jgi:hypothetical protein
MPDNGSNRRSDLDSRGPGEQLPMASFFAACARALVDGQSLLDEHACDSMQAWSEDGLPPSAFMWSGCRLSFPVAYNFQRKTNPAQLTGISIAPRPSSMGSLTLGIRYLPAPLSEDEL